MKKTLLILGIAALAAIVAGAAFVVPIATAKTSAEGWIRVSPEMTDEAIADSLSARFGEGFGGKVTKVLKFRGVKPSRCVGAYFIEEGTTAIDVGRRLMTRQQTPVRLTFNSLRTAGDFATVAARTLELDEADLLPLLTDSAHCASIGFTPATMPAMLLPDTYEFYWTASPEQVVAKMKKAYDAFWTEERREKAAALGLTPEEVSTLASIVDSETAYRPEKGTIARLYMNRLRIGMKLQSDPTVKFAIGDPTLRRITHRHLTVDSPYNTYAVAGLPPGPIRLPEKATIDAVLNAPQNDYLYMCAKEDFSGSHNFTRSYSEHQQNALRYQRELNRRGIK